MGFALFEVTLQAGAALPSIDSFAVGPTLGKVTDIRIGSFRLALPFRQLGAFVAVTFISTAKVRVAHPAVVRHRRRYQCQQDGATEQHK